MELDQITKEKEELKTLLSHMKVIRSESATLKQEYINNEESRRQLQENYYKVYKRNNNLFIMPLRQSTSLIKNENNLKKPFRLKPMTMYINYYIYIYI